ncbi:MAG: hypothetical protein L6420_03585, partial [Elusimicrobia bacterium]|nr:hypothetical protein [Elusimicrobiota bacterium]
MTGQHTQATKLCFIPAIKAGQASVGNYALRNLEDSKAMLGAVTRDYVHQTAKDVSPVNEVTRGERPRH